MTVLIISQLSNTVHLYHMTHFCDWCKEYKGSSEGVSSSVISSCKRISHPLVTLFSFGEVEQRLGTCVRQSHITFPEHTLCGKYPSVSFLPFLSFFLSFTVSVCLFLLPPPPPTPLSLFPPWCNNRLVSHFLPEEKNENDRLRVWLIIHRRQRLILYYKRNANPNKHIIIK